MKKLFKNIISFILCVTLISCAVPYSSIKADALSGSTYTKNTTLASRFNTLVTNYVPGTSFYTKNGKACACHANSSINCIAATHQNCNCLRIIQYNGKSIDLGTVQCFGYARYCQQILYGVNEYTNSDYFEKIAGPGSVTGTTLKNWFVTNKNKIGMGTHIRLHKGRHSVSIVKVDYDAGNIIYLEANWTSQSSNSGNWCRVNALRTSTWAQFASKYSSYINYAMVLKNFSTLYPETPVYPLGVYQTTGAVNLLNNAGSGSTVASVAQGTQLEVVNRSADGTWAYIHYGNTYCWCPFSSLTFVRDFHFTIVFDMQGNGTNITKVCALGEAFAPPVAPKSTDGRTVESWCVTRASDGKFLATSGAWVSTGTKIGFKEGTALAIVAAHTNPNVGDDTFIFSPNWKEAITTESLAKPAGYGWYWSDAEAYGYMGGFGSASQDLCLSIDLCLLPSSADSVASFYTKSGANMTVSKDRVSIGNTTVAYNWGELSWENWHKVQFLVINGVGSVYIDGTIVAYQASGIEAYTDYQLLFSQSGSMAIDNAALTDSTGSTTYFKTDFEDATAANKIFHADGEGLGERVYLSISSNPPITPPTPPTPPEPEYQQGDLNNDGRVNASDVLALKLILVGKDTSTSVADINKDGRINTADILCLLCIIVGKASL